MNAVSESYIGTLLLRFWAALCAVWEESDTRRLFARLGRGGARLISGSAVLTMLLREGAVSLAWRDSVVCRTLTVLLNLPAILLHKLYTAFPAVFDGSFFARLAFSVGDETAVAESWVIMLLWVIPFDYWNNAYSLMGFFLLLLLFYAGGMRRRTLRLDLGAVGPYAAFFFAAVCLAVPFSAYPSLSTRFLTYHVICGLCVLVTVSAVRRMEDLKRLMAGGTFVVLVSSLYGFYQRLQGVEVNASYTDLTVNADMPGRVESFFDNPNTFAQVLILLLPLAMVLVLNSRRWYSRLAAAGIFVVGVGALGMTYSRASWVGFACGLVVFIFLWKPKLLPGCFVLGLLCIPFLPASILHRVQTITNFSDTSTASRVPLYEAALALIRRSPVSGAGLGTAAVQKYIDMNNLYHARAPFVHAHDMYLQIWIEAGLLGIVSFVGSMLWSIKRSAAAVRHGSPSAARTMVCAGAGALAGSMVCGLADYLWNYPRVMCIFWFVFALTLAAVRLCREEAVPDGSAFPD